MLRGKDIYRGYAVKKRTLKRIQRRVPLKPNIVVPSAGSVIEKYRNPTWGAALLSPSVFMQKIRGIFHTLNAYSKGRTAFKLGALTQKFDKDYVEDAGKDLFESYYGAMAAGDAMAIRDFVTPDYYPEVKVPNLPPQTKGQYVGAVDDVKVEHLRHVGVEQDQVYDFIQAMVRFQGHHKVELVDKKTKQLQDNRVKRADFDEWWVMERPLKNVEHTTWRFIKKLAKVTKD